MEPQYFWGLLDFFPTISYISFHTVEVLNWRQVYHVKSLRVDSTHLLSNFHKYLPKNIKLLDGGIGFRVWKLIKNWRWWWLETNSCDFCGRVVSRPFPTHFIGANIFRSMDSKLLLRNRKSKEISNSIFSSHHN